MPASRLTATPRPVAAFAVVGTSRTGKAPRARAGATPSATSDCCRPPPADRHGPTLALRIWTWSWAGRTRSTTSAAFRQTTGWASRWRSALSRTRRPSIPARLPWGTWPLATGSAPSDESNAIEAFLAFVAYRPYVMLCHPPVQTRDRDPDGDRAVTHYSCVGLVLECYRGGGPRPPRRHARQSVLPPIRPRPAPEHLAGDRATQQPAAQRDRTRPAAPASGPWSPRLRPARPGSTPAIPCRSSRRPSTRRVFEPQRITLGEFDHGPRSVRPRADLAGLTCMSVFRSSI